MIMGWTLNMNRVLKCDVFDHVLVRTSLLVRIGYQKLLQNSIKKKTPNVT